VWVEDIPVANERLQMYAIVKTGGKQYKVAESDVIDVEKLAAEPDSTIELEVVFIADGSKVITDADALQKAKVIATVVEQFKGDKQIIFKFKKRKGYKRLRGHRQNLTKLKIDSISLGDKAPKATKKTYSKKVAEDEEATAEKKPARKNAAKKDEVDAEAIVEEKPARRTRAKKVEAEAETVAAAEDKTEAVTKAEVEAKAETEAEAEAIVEEKPKRKTIRKTPEDKKEE